MHTSLQHAPDTDDQAVTFHLSGTFDRQAALALARAIAGLTSSSSTPSEVRLDFSQVSLVEANSIPLLTQAVGPERIRLRGLSRHFERVFQWFGVPRESPPTPIPEVAGL